MVGVSFSHQLFRDFHHSRSLTKCAATLELGVE